LIAGLPFSSIKVVSVRIKSWPSKENIELPNSARLNVEKQNKQIKIIFFIVFTLINRKEYD
jgi:hypothetical protein